MIRQVSRLSVMIFVLLLSATIVSASEKPELVVQTGHGAPTFWLEYLKDPNFILSSDMFSTKIWNLTDGHCMKTIHGSFRSLSRDKKLLLVQCNDSTIQLWNLDDLTLMREFKNIPGKVMGDFYPSFSISPDGQYLAAAMSHSFMMWSLHDGILQKELVEGVGRVEFSPDGKLIAIGDYSGKNPCIALFDYREWKKMREISGEPFLSDGDNFTFSPDGKYIVSPGKVWRIEDGNCIYKRSPEVKYGSEFRQCFSPDGRFLLMLCYENLEHKQNQIITLIDLDTRSEKKIELPPEMRIVGGVSFSPNCATIAMGDETGSTIALWDLNSSCFTQVMGKRDNSPSADGILSIRFSPDETHILSGHFSGTIKLWDMKTGIVAKTISSSLTWYGSGGRRNSSMKISSDGRWLIWVSSGEKTLQIWDIRSTKPFKKSSAFISERSPVPEHDFPCTFRISHNCRYVVSIDEKGNLKTWDLEKGTLQSGKPSGQIHRAVALDISKDCRYAASADHTGNVIVWDIAKCTPLRSMKGQRYNEGGVLFSPDGKYIASSATDWGSKFFAIEIWNTLTGARVASLKGHPGRIDALSFSPDGRFFATGSCSQTSSEPSDTLKIWKTATWKCIKTIKNGRVSDIEFSPDGRFLITSGHGARLFEAKEWRCINEINDIYVPVKLSPDRNTLLVFDDFGQMTVRELETGKSERLQGTLDIQGRDMIWSSNGKNIVSGDGVWSRSGNQLCAFVPFLDGNWVAYTPEGYFDCSEGGKKYIGWTVGMKHYPAERFFDEFYTPGLISSVIKGETLSKRHDLRQGFLLPPDVTIVSPKSGGKVQGDTVDVTVEARDIGGGIEDLRLYHQGKLLSTPKSVDSASPGNDKTRIVRYSVKLLEGDNVLRATAYNNGHTVESNPFEVMLRCDAAPGKVKAYVLAVGINSYKDSRLALKNSRQDAEALAECLRTKGAALFSFQDVSLLCDGKATRENILKAFEGIRDKANPEDVVILYLSGHGDMNPVDGEYYFLPYEFDMKWKIEEIYRERGISGSSMGRLLREVKARKVLMILDTCHAEGAQQAFRSPAEIKAYKMLAKSWGIHVLAATREGQMGSEIETLGHGLFTYAILEGLNGKADTDKEGIVTVRSLMHYVENEVESLSEKYMRVRQSPVTDSRGMDFPLVVK